MENKDPNRLLEVMLPSLMQQVNEVLLQHDLGHLCVTRLELSERPIQKVKPHIDLTNDVFRVDKSAESDQDENLMIAAHIPPPPPVPDGCTAEFSEFLNKWIIVCT